MSTNDNELSCSVGGLFMAFVEHFHSTGLTMQEAGDLAVESMRAFRKYVGLPEFPPGYEEDKS